jgi:hypothetical protein
MFSFTNTKPDEFQGINNTTFNAEDNIFVICENNIPILYTNQETEAKDHIKSLTLKKKHDLLIENSDYNYYITLEENSISLWSIYKNWIISFDKLIVEYAYYSIKKL